MSEARFNVLMICTGNICRSPAAERLLFHALGSPSTLLVRSAGTGATPGTPVDPHIEQLLQGSGISADDHQSRYLTKKLVDESDLILGMTKAHRSAAVALSPAAVRRSFTLSGFAEIAAAIPCAELDQASASDTIADRLRAVVALAPRYRPVGPSPDIDDPFRRDAATYARVFSEIVTAIEAITSAASPSGPDGRMAPE